MQPHQFTLYHFLHEYNQNRDLIEAYLKGESIEGFQAETDGKDKKDNDEPEISGFAIGVFLTFFVILRARLDWRYITSSRSEISSRSKHQNTPSTRTGSFHSSTLLPGGWKILQRSGLTPTMMMKFSKGKKRR